MNNLSTTIQETSPHTLQMSSLYKNPKGRTNEQKHSINSVSEESELHQSNDKMTHGVINKDNDLDMTISPSGVDDFHPALVRPTRESVLRRLSEALLRRSLTKIDLSQRGLLPTDARLVKMALQQNRRLSVLKLGYNNLEDAGACILADGIGPLLESLDLGFNRIGDEGCAAVCRAIPVGGRLHTLYLAGNLIGQEGAMAVADMIKRRSCLRRLFLAGNLIGPDGVTAIANSILEEEVRRGEGQALTNDLLEDPKTGDYITNSSVEEVYLGGSGMGELGCRSIARLVQNTHRIRVLSLPNCELGDEMASLLAYSINMNREKLPLESLQLSFNRISCDGVEQLANALCGSTTLKTILLDNNEMEDRGARHIALSLIQQIKCLETLNVGFNRIKSSGIKMMMKAVLESQSLQTLSISGNAIDTSAAKSIAYALAYNVTLTSLSVVHCNIGSEGQHNIAAGLVSNRHVSLREFSGFAIGAIVVKLGFPLPLESWSNKQILNFIHLMWAHYRTTNSLSHDIAPEDETMNDPLNLLGGNFTVRSAPPDAAIVVDVAKKAFSELASDGPDDLSGRDDCLSDISFASPIINDGIIVESSSHPTLIDMPATLSNNDRRSSSGAPSRVDSFIASPESHTRSLIDPSRKKRVADWLSSNLADLKKLADRPFSSSELWRLHQHYFTPVVNECGGAALSVANGVSISCIPEVSNNGFSTSADGTNSCMFPGAMANTQQSSPTHLVSLPLIKRKISYRSLADAARSDSRINAREGPNQQSVPMMIEAGPAMHSLAPMTKRARRNRSRISFLPRIKKKLDTSLDLCHEKALMILRQLYYVEKTILRGEVNPMGSDQDTHPQTHLCGDLASDAEMILVDML